MVLRRGRSSNADVRDDEGSAGRALRRWRRGALVAGGVALGLAVPQIAGAVTSPYPDVPASHPFVTDIAWAKNLGIVDGYPDGNYRPGTAVSRGSMTAFLHRLYNIQEVSGTAISDVANVTSSIAWKDLPGATVTINTPASVPVVVYALFTAETSCIGTSELYCQVRLLVDPPGDTDWTVMAPTGSDLAFAATTPVAEFQTHSVQGIIANSGSGQYQVKVQYRVVAAPADTFRVDDFMLRVETDLMNT